MKSTPWGLGVGLFNILVAAVLFFVAVDPTNSDATRIVSALFFLSWTMALHHVRRKEERAEAERRREWRHDEQQKRAQELLSAIHTLTYQLEPRRPSHFDDA